MFWNVNVLRVKLLINHGEGYGDGGVECQPRLGWPKNSREEGIAFNNTSSEVDVTVIWCQQHFLCVTFMLIPTWVIITGFPNKMATTIGTWSLVALSSIDSNAVIVNLIFIIRHATILLAALFSQIFAPQEWVISG